MMVDATLYPKPPSMVSQAKTGLYLVNHQDRTSISRKAKGVAMMINHPNAGNAMPAIEALLRWVHDR